MTDIQAVIFDLDGVLVDSEHLWGEGALQFYKKLGLKNVDVIYWKKQSMGRTQDDLIRMFKEAFHLSQPHDVLKEMKLQATITLFEQRLRAKDGAHDFMKDASKKYKTAIATASPLFLAEKELEIAGLAGIVTAVVSAEEVKKGKPAPDVYLRAAEKLGVLPENSLAIEDAPRGVTAARLAGMRCVGIVDRYFTREELVRAGADPVITSLRDFQVDP